MSVVKHSLIIVLVIAMLCSALPIFAPEDTHKDGKIGLEDAILSVALLAQSAEKPEMFRESIKKFILTAQMLAGFKTVIKQENIAKSTPDFFNFDFSYLISSVNFLFPFSNYSQISEQISSYKSIFLSLVLPPPQ